MCKKVDSRSRPSGLHVQVGQAAPIVAALIKGTDKERVVSEQYGGSGGQQATTDEVYQAIGNVSSLGTSTTVTFQDSVTLLEVRLYDMHCLAHRLQGITCSEQHGSCKVACCCIILLSPLTWQAIQQLRPIRNQRVALLHMGDIQCS